MLRVRRHSHPACIMMKIRAGVKIKNTDTFVTFPASACHQIMWDTIFHHA